MSILIKGMEMPKSCEECFAREHIEADTDHCAFDYCVFENWHQPRTPLVLTPKELKSKAPYCPLGDVPPHGRLIDADGLERVAEDMQKQAEYFDERARQLVCDSGEVSQYSWAVSLRETYRRFVKTLDEISTSAIIEAEEGE